MVITETVVLVGSRICRLHRFVSIGRMKEEESKKPFFQMAKKIRI
jgi:hypothetical protein